MTITFLHINGVTMKGMTYRNDKTGEATVEHTCDARAVFDKLAIIVVTYKRQQLLEELLASFAQLTVAPWRIVIVDNEHSDETQDMVDEFREKADGLWGTPTEKVARAVWCTLRKPTILAVPVGFPSE